MEIFASIMWLVSELWYIIRVFSGWIFAYFKRLPPSNQQIATAAAATFFTIFAINFVHLQTLTRISSKLREKKHSRWLILPLVIVIGISIGFMWKVNVVGEPKPEGIEGIVNEILGDVDGAYNEINAIDVSEFEWKEGADCWSEMNSTLDSKLAALVDEGLLQGILEKDETYNSTGKDMENAKIYRKWLEDNKEALSGCGITEVFDVDKWVEITLTERAKVRNATNNLDNEVMSTRSSIKQIVHEQKELDFGKNLLKGRLSSMKNIIVTLRSDVLNSEPRKNELHRQSIDQLPTMTYGLVVRTIVSATCLFLILIASTSITSIVFCKEPMASADQLDDCADTATIVVIVCVVVLFFSSLGYFAKNTCPLSSDVGFDHFTSQLNVCPRRESTIFELINKHPILPSELIRQNLKVVENTKKIEMLMVGLDADLDALAQFGCELDRMKNMSGIMDDLVKDNRLKEKLRNDMTPYHKAFKDFVGGNSEFNNLLVTFTQNVAPKRNNISIIIDLQYTKIVDFLKRSISPLETEISSIDIACESMLDNFGKIRNAICSPIVNQMQDYQLILFGFLAFSVSAVLVQIAEVRLFSFWFVDFTDESDDDSEWE